MGAELFVTLIASSIGAGVFLYGKKMRRAPPMVVGLVLMGVPYFLPGVWWIASVAAALLVGLWWTSRAGW